MECAFHIDCRKVKAHVKNSEMNEVHRGNELADLWAKKAAGWASPSEAEAKGFVMESKQHKNMLKGMATILEAWPPSEHKKDRNAKRAGRGKAWVPHLLFWNRGKLAFSCRMCGRGSTCKSTLEKFSCAGRHEQQSSWAAIGLQGHKMMAVGEWGQVALVFCRACGCYVEGAAKGSNLRRSCRGKLSSQICRLKKLVQGCHPL